MVDSNSSGRMRRLRDWLIDRFFHAPIYWIVTAVETVVKKIFGWIASLIETLWHYLVQVPIQMLDLLWHKPKQFAIELVYMLWHGLVIWPISTVSSGVKTLTTAWQDSARFRDLVFGLPALALLIFVVAVGSMMQKKVDRASQYYLAANKALRNQDYTAAQIYSDRLLEIQGPRNETLFNLVEISQQLGDQQRAVLLMEQLSPLDATVHGPAHLLRAQSLLSGIRPDELERLQRAETQLRHAQRAMPHSERVRAMLGTVYILRNDPENAIEQFEPIAESVPEVLLMLAQCYAQIGDVKSAEQYGTMSQQYYEQQSHGDPTNRELRLHWARATTFIEQFPLAIEILERGKASPEDTSYLKPIVNVHLTWFDYLLGQKEQDKGAMLQVLQQAIDLAPNEELLFQRVMTVLDFGDDSSEELRTQLAKILGSGQDVPLIHVILGTDAGVNGDIQLAIRHLEIAVKQDPQMLVAANNLAWFLSNKDDPDLDTAFALIDAVATRWPDHAYVLDTRGQILAKQGKWQDALIDLKAALPVLAEYQPIHETLDQVYRELGMTDLAKFHAGKAAEISANEQANLASQTGGKKVDPAVVDALPRDGLPKTVRNAEPSK